MGIIDFVLESGGIDKKYKPIAVLTLFSFIIFIIIMLIPNGLDDEGIMLFFSLTFSIALIGTGFLCSKVQKVDQSKIVGLGFMILSFILIILSIIALLDFSFNFLISGVLTEGKNILLFISLTILGIGLFKLGQKIYGTFPKEIKFIEITEN